MPRSSLNSLGLDPRKVLDPLETASPKLNFESMPSNNSNDTIVYFTIVFFVSFLCRILDAPYLISNFLLMAIFDFYRELDARSIVGSLYISLGLIGLLCNLATVIMIISKRVFRLSAYTIMANVALSDAIMLIVAGIVCGLNLIWPEIDECLREPSKVNSSYDKDVYYLESTPQNNDESDLKLNQCHFLSYCLSFFEITSWTAGVVSYAYLGLNRCVAICFYGTKAKIFNQVSVAVVASFSTWIIGIIPACIGTFPAPLVGNQLEMWSISFKSFSGQRSVIFVAISLLINLVSVITQWVCSTMVLMKIRKVKQKINMNKLNHSSATRFHKQARLTFQFFYPSLLCTVSSFLYFAKPYIRDSLSDSYFIVLHLIWLGNHACNPFIYAYFNDRMRVNYEEILTCAKLRREMRKRRKPFGRGRSLKRSFRGTGQTSMRSLKSPRNGNFVRNSLQMQSRDFEQLCEFMMRAGLGPDSSEGWRESEDETDEESECKPFEIKSEGMLHPHRESKSIVMDLGRQTVEHWARFAKKASI